ncbi:MAG: KH domain-containing protein [Oscillospiraceae bacterium]|jgi:predicted RNA-binding protein YlqC (UPF0109 family)|nr:KH domain-containing protein [Oscillospiraceae bacterium]
MTELLTYIAKSLVDNPDDIVVTSRVAGNETVLELRANKSDMGKVIGRGGRIAREIRTVVRAAGARRGLNVTVDILD